MTRFPSALMLVAILGCAGSAPSEPALVPLSAAPPSAFSVAPEDLQAAPQVWRQNLNPAELLGFNLQDYPAARLAPGENPQPAAAETEPLQRVIDILREFVAPPRWNRSSLSVEGGALVARQSPAVLVALQSALQTLRDNRERMIRSRVRMVALRADALARFENIPPASGGLVGVFDRDALRSVLGEALVGGTAPHITTFHGQKSHVMFLRQASYVAGFEAGAGTYDPQLGVTTDGVVMDLRSIANGSRPDEFLVSFEAQLASPSQVVDVRLASGVLQMPAQGYARLSGRCALRSDQALLVVTRNPDLRIADRPLLALEITVDWGR